MTDTQVHELDLRKIVASLINRGWMIALFVVIAAIASFVLSERSPRVYEATSVVRISNPNSENVFQSGAAVAIDPKRLVDTEIGVVKSASLRDTVDQSLGDRAGDVGDVRVENPSGTDLLRLSVAAPNAELARDAANEFANAYLTARRTQAVQDLDQRSNELRSKATDIADQVQRIDDQLDRGEGSADVLRAQRNALTAQQADFNNRANQLEVEASVRRGSAQLVDAATTPETHIAPRPIRSALTAAVLAFILAVGFVLLLDRLDDRIKGPEDLERVTGGLPLFGSVPIFAPKKKRGLKHLPKGDRTLVPLDSIDAENYRTLRTNLRFSNLGKNKRVIMVTSSSGSEGKSTIISNLAVSLAEGGQRVVLVSADLRRPSLGTVFGIDESGKGLTSVLLGDASLTDCLVPFTLESGQRLYLLPTGPLPHNPAELLGSQAMSNILAALADADTDIVLVDCPPVLPVSDPLAVAQLVDGVLLITVVNQTKIHDLQEAHRRLQQVDADIIGVVLNGVPTRGHRYSYAYYRRDDYRSEPASRVADTSPMSRRSAPERVADKRPAATRPVVSRTNDAGLDKYPEPETTRSSG